MNPPPVYTPRELQKDPETKAFIDALLVSDRLVWTAVAKTLGQASLTASDTNTPNSGDATTDAIIANLQTRVDELEAILLSLGG
jgi:hypothetical protein